MNKTVDMSWNIEQEECWAYWKFNIATYSNWEYQPMH